METVKIYYILCLEKGVLTRKKFPIDYKEKTEATSERSTPSASLSLSDNSDSDNRNDIDT